MRRTREPRRSQRRRRAETGTALAALIIAALGLGCAEGSVPDASRAPTLVATDSAGIEVVVTQPLDAPTHTVTLEAEVGSAEGPEAFQLSNVSAASILPDGRLVVADGGSQELRFFGPDGLHIASGGGRGEGPGEFAGLSRIAVDSGGSVVAYDQALSRFSRFSPDGGFLDSRQVDGSVSPYFVGALASGDRAVWQFYGPDASSLGVHAAAVEFGVLEAHGASGGSPSATLFRSLGTATGSEEARIRDRGRETRGFRPFGREADVAAGGDHLYVLSSDVNNRIEVHDPETGLLRVLAIDDARLAPTDERVERWVESWMETFGPASDEVEAFWRAGFDQVPPPDSIPLLRSLAVDMNGHVCAERYPERWGDETDLTCFAPDGRPLRRLVLPPGRVQRGPHPYFDPPLQITQDRVIGVWADDLGVERVRVYRIDALPADPPPP